MRSSDSAHFVASTRSAAGSRHRRPNGRSWLRSIEFSRTVPQDPTQGYARYVGRVGALAIALGVGSAVASMPVAFADTAGSAGSSTDASSSSSAGSTEAALAAAFGPWRCSVVVERHHQQQGVAAQWCVTAPAASRTRRSTTTPR